MARAKAGRNPGSLLSDLWRRRIAMSRVGATSPSPITAATVPDAAVIRQPRVGSYRVELTATEAERRAAFRLRFCVFNLEMNEGLESSYQTGEDEDAFDSVCDHLIARHETTGEIVGTYRLQTGETAARKLGYYSQREFKFAPYEALRSQMVELGRACIHPDHRKYEVLVLLWKGIAHYARERNANYLIGCSSISSEDQRVGSAMYQSLTAMLAPQELRTSPQSGYDFSLTADDATVNPPKLLRAYLSVGARICGPPALDREFHTIDFLTLMDLNTLAPSVRSRFMES